MISIEFLHECFVINADKLYWRYRPASHFVGEKEFMRWNSRYSNREVGAQLNHGYRRIRILINGKRKNLAEHRVIFAIINGYFPAEVDHRNRDRSCNVSSNLRDATRSLNQANKRSTREDGIKGICWEESRNKWKASIRCNGKKLHLGRFLNKEEAYQAYVKAANSIFGEFARFE